MVCTLRGTRNSNHFIYDFLVDPKVEVIYISPVELNDEVYQYYSKLLGMKARRLDKSDSNSKETGDEEEDDIENRYKIIVPDAVDRFPVSQRRYTQLLIVYFSSVIEQRLIKPCTILEREQFLYVVRR